MPDYMQLVLANIADGTLDEKFDKVMKEVTANIQDLNTPAAAKRSILIRIDFEPDETREQAQITTDVKPVLVGQKKKKSICHFVVDPKTAKYKAVTATFHQRDLFEVKDAKDERDRVTDSSTDPNPPAA